MGLRPTHGDENAVKVDVGQTIGFCRLSPSRGLIHARQTTQGDGLSHVVFFNRVVILTRCQFYWPAP
jgi:hypothetical protein